MKTLEEKKCPSCNGEKEVRTWVDGEMDISTCGRCNGKGYIILDNMKQNKTLEEIKKEFKKNFCTRGVVGFTEDRSDDPTPYSFDEIWQFIQSTISQTKQELIEEIDPFDLVEPCEPDCTPERHAYHQGTWDSYLKLEKILEKLSNK